MKKLILIFSLFLFSGISLKAQNDVPTDVLERYKSSFIYEDNGVVRGANIDELSEYMTESEIVVMFTHDVLESASQAGIGGPGPNIYAGFKPKPRGCKKNRRWICSIFGTVVSS